jgi:GTP-binding protein HflX
VKTVALVGYTSAGKTTLFNILTGKKKYSDQSLFTTLDTVVGKIKLEKYIPAVLVSDTIGFIEDLPPVLIEAFRSTLLESMESQILLHVIDASDPHISKKITTVNEILAGLEADQQRVLVFNKIDLLSTAALGKLKAKYNDDTNIFVSAKTGNGIDILKQETEKLLGRV